MLSRTKLRQLARDGTTAMRSRAPCPRVVQFWYFRTETTMKTDWTSYPSPRYHDELVGPGGGPRAAGRALMRCLTEMDGHEIAVRQQAAELAIKAMGITFTVYHSEADGSQAGSIDRAWPLDIIPRTISRK